MAASTTREISVCGLDCSACDIRNAPFDPQAADRVVSWFKEMKWLKEEEGVQEVIERGMYCKGCRGDRTVHWSADCSILTCCVDEKQLASCAECEDFACSRLTDRASTSARYAQALQRLQDMRQESR